MACRKIFILFCLLLIANLAFAEKLGGTITVNNQQVFLSTSEGLVYLISSYDPAVRENLSKLKTQDYLNATGEYIEEEGRMEVTGINYVGLNALLGLWRTENWELFEFKDFYTLNLYLPFAPDRSGKVERRSVAYTVIPDQTHNWTILLMENNSVATGHLTMGNRQAFIDVLDNQTGKPRMILQLTPVMLESDSRP